MAGAVARIENLLCVVDIAVEVLVGIRDVNVNAVSRVDIAAFIGNIAAGAFERVCDDSVLAGLDVGIGLDDFLIVAFDCAGEDKRQRRAAFDNLEIARAGLVGCEDECALVIGSDCHGDIVAEDFAKLLVEYN